MGAAKGLEQGLEYTAVAVFCRADYKKADGFASLNHWVPAMPCSEVDFADSQLQASAKQAESYFQEQIKLLESQALVCEEDPVALASVQQHIQMLQDTRQNFLEMQDQLFHGHQIVCSHARGDGNCGVYMLLSMIRDIQASKLTVGDVMAFRKDLSQLWLALSSDPLWQKIWSALRQHVGAPADSGCSTPQAKKAKGKELDFTPDKVTGSKRLLPSSGDLHVIRKCQTCM